MRVFFALWPTPAVVSELSAVAQDVATSSGGRAPPAGALHITLAFLGEVPDTAVEELEMIGSAVARAASPFEIVLDRIGFFVGARIAWAGCTGEPPVLAEMAASLRETLHKRGCRTEHRTFRTHVTLARGCRNRPRAVPIRLAWRAREIALVHSVLGGAHARYENLAAWPLGSPSGVAL